MKALWVGLMVLAVAAPASADVLKTKHDTAKNSVGNIRAVADSKVAGPVNVPRQETLKGIAQNVRAVADAKVAGPTIMNAVVDAKVAGVNVPGLSSGNRQDAAVADAKVAGPTIINHAAADAKAQAKSRAVKARIVLDLNAPKSGK